MAKKNALGRGLGALINDANEISTGSKASASIMEVDIADIEANPWQPRTTFDEEKLNELKSLNGGNIKLEHLSMGMSNDYRIAVEEGATFVRIGTAIFRGGEK